MCFTSHRQAPHQVDAEPLHSAADEAGDEGRGGQAGAVSRDAMCGAQGVQSKIHALGGRLARVAGSRNSRGFRQPRRRQLAQSRSRSRSLPAEPGPAARSSPPGRTQKATEKNVRSAGPTAFWTQFGVSSPPRRRTLVGMHTSDLVPKLMESDEGRWRVANKGKPIDEYYLRSKLKGYVQPGAKGPEGETRPRQWRPEGSPTVKWGYHELHFADAFLRYLGKGIAIRGPAPSR